MTRPREMRRSIWGWLILFASNQIAKGQTQCARCGLPHHLVQFDTVDLGGGRGIHTLCTKCAAKLTRKEQLVYFRHTWETRWKRDRDWDAIERAVLSQPRPIMEGIPIEGLGLDE